jgi:hypothetical protein
MICEAGTTLVAEHYAERLTRNKKAVDSKWPFKDNQQKNTVTNPFILGDLRTPIHPCPQGLHPVVACQGMPRTIPPSQ